jgi:RNA polymerase sigma-70 factor (ECF subfamily)
MLAFQAGDESAFEKLVQRNQSNVHAVIYRFLGDQSDVEDLAQEVFLRVYRTADRYVPTAKFTTWLYRIAANLSLNAIRSRSKARVSQLEMPDDDGPAGGFYREVEDTHGESPSDDLDAAELHEQILAAIHSLPENQRIAIILNKFEQMRYDEIAEVLGVSMMAVKSLLSRARNNLRQSLRRFMKP